MNEKSSNGSTCNYVSLGKYNGASLGQGPVAFVQYPQLSGVQLIPNFKGVSYDTPNYDSLVHGACSLYPNVNQAYMDGDCVTYVERPCQEVPKPQPPRPQPPRPQPPGPNNSGGQFGFQCSPKIGCHRVNSPPSRATNTYTNMKQCQDNCK
jgi:hypothetical protein